MLLLEHWGAVEADLSTYHQVANPLALTWRRLSLLVRYLPASGAFIRAVHAAEQAALKAESPADAFPEAETGEAPEWLAEYNRIHKIKATYVDLDLLRGGELPDGERVVS